MTKELYIQNTKIRYLFYLLMSGILVWFLILQAFGTNERDINEVSGMPVYHGSFTWQKSDGSSEKITVPGRYSVSPEDTMVITSTLPEDYNSNTLAVRSSLQSVRFYINGKLRSEYDTKDTRLAGKNSASRYFSVRHLMQMPVKNCVSNYAPIPNNTPVLSIRYIAVIRSIYGNSCSHNTVWKQSLHFSCCLQV